MLRGQAEIDKVFSIIEECFVDTLKGIELTVGVDWDDPKPYLLFTIKVFSGTELETVHQHYKDSLARCVREVSPELNYKFFTTFEDDNDG